uniref:Protein TsetseEP domain-containing protein n=1 Tax=Clastoptera arizonana TaxID=38151 RepID=A0A1B6DEJ6_9HEMI
MKLTVYMLIILVTKLTSALPLDETEKAYLKKEDCINSLTAVGSTGFSSTTDTIKAGGEFVRFCFVECYNIFKKTLFVGSSQIKSIIEDGKATSPMSTLEEGSKLMDCFLWCLEKIGNVVNIGSKGIVNMVSSGKNFGVNILKS